MYITTVKPSLNLTKLDTRNPILTYFLVDIDRYGMYGVQ